MSTEPAISVKGLSKRYQLGTIGRHTLVDEVQYWWHKMRGRDPHEYFSKIGHSATESRKVDAERKGADQFWALKDVSFDVQPGAVIGIIGRNGAGKSTLLKILTRITEPTSGEAFINGRVASLLEVGTGFHPDLTGRENIYMNGTILGMKKREIAAKFDEIVAFSELEQFIDTPVKRYSSGMYVRLAFAVAAHLEPEILLVDEVLAVGDVSFQEKCLGKLGEMMHVGRTVLFVSHNMGAVRKLCPRVLWLDKGRVEKMGDTHEVLDAYLARMVNREGEFRPDPPASAAMAGPMTLRRVSLLNERGECAASFGNNGRAMLQIEYEVSQVTAQTRIGFRLSAEDGTVVLTSVDTDPDGRGTVRELGCYVARCVMPLHVLNGGRYNLGVFGHRRLGREPLFEYENILSFVVHVVSGVGSITGESRLGVVRLDCPWETHVREA